MRVRKPALHRGAVLVVGVVVCLWTAHFAQPVLVPVVCALFLKALLAPAVRRLQRWGVPKVVGAGIVLPGLLGLLATGIWFLAPEAGHWAGLLPQRLESLRDRFWELREPVQAISKVTEEVSEKVENLASASGMASKKAEPTVVRIEQSPWPIELLGGLRQLAVAFSIIAGLSFLLLASDGQFSSKLRGSAEIGGRSVRLALRSIEAKIGVWALTSTVVNLGLGVAVGLAMWACGMPSPILWGTLAGIANFVPYVGLVVVFGLIALVAATTFETWGEILLPPALHAGCNLIEAGFVTPLALGRSLTLSPVAISIWLLVMGFLWGVVGVLLAVPLLVAIKIFAEYVPGLEWLDLVLGSAREAEVAPDAELAVAASE
ncbi:MAG: AI-2E family transporter [Planctomycetes bacterium]|nr:AI-2E family transporter [Planctomycetota bacterium]